MTLREYLDGRGESLKAFCVRKQIPMARGQKYFYRRNTTMKMGNFLRDLNIIRAETNGLVDADGMTHPGGPMGKVVYIGRGRPPKEVNKKTVGKKRSGTAA